jgi:hypothetical protein
VRIGRARREARLTPDAVGRLVNIRLTLDWVNFQWRWGLIRL